MIKDKPFFIIVAYLGFVMVCLVMLIFMDIKRDTRLLQANTDDEIKIVCDKYYSLTAIKDLPSKCVQ